jgi:hypothetical protein
MGRAIHLMPLYAFMAWTGTALPLAPLTRYIDMFQFWLKSRVKVTAYHRLRRLVAGLPLRRPGFDPGSVHVGFVVEKVALGQVFLRVVGFSLSISFH